MKTFVGGTIVILLFATHLASAENACRDFRKAPEYKQRDLSSIVAVDASIFASVKFENRSPTDTFAIRGTFCDSQLAPLPGRNLRVVRVSRAEAGQQPLLADAFTSGEARELEAHTVVTSENGKFLVSGLAAGEYVLDVDWEELSATQFVVFDLRHIPGPPLRSSVEQVGLLRP